MKTILCTIDFSKSTRHSIEWAVSMARHMRAHLSILYTYRLIQPRSEEVIAMKKFIEQDAREKFTVLEKELLVKEGVSYDFKIEVGFISDRIEDHAKKNPLDFVVMDKTMRSNSNESLDELMEHIHVPMLVVP
ncbi:MAG: universal stress protein [Cyclobacteriaceae bacterium]|nr:universal stress protein [Cyclobacteriaceae bacterium]